MDLVENLSTWLTLLYAQVPARKMVFALKHIPDLCVITKASTTFLKAHRFTDKQIAKIKSPPIKAIEQDMLWLKQNPQVQIVTFLDPAYPQQLLEISDPPILLFIEGDHCLLQSPQIAMVGARKATPYGISCAIEFANALAAQGFVVTSGLAAGIDAASHTGALRLGKTIAVIGTGLKYCYPSQHKKLATEIKHQGAIVSEFPPNTKPRANHFPKRNRIISGLSLGVLVIEAAEKSGSLITAKCALDQNRDVFAVPGSIYSMLSRGCHVLIREGAKLVDNIQDITSEMPASKLPKIEKKQEKLKVRPVDLTCQHENKDQYLDKAHQNLLDCVGDAAISVDKLINLSGLTSEAVSEMLLRLEIAGYVVSVPGGYQQKRKA